MNIDQGVIVAVLAHAAATIWWASKMNTTMGFIRIELEEMNKEGMKKHEQNQIELKAIWRRVDEMKSEIVNIKEDKK